MTARGHAFITLRSKSATHKVTVFREWLFGELSGTSSWWTAFLSDAERRTAG